MAKHTVTNISKGIRGFHSVDGLVELAPGGKAEDVEISAGELASAKRTEWFEIDGAGDATDDNETDDLDVTVPKLREIAKAEGIDLAGMTSKGDIQGAIRIGREAKTSEKPEGDDALADMDDATLRTTVQAITGKSEAELADLDRDALLALARDDK